MIGFIKDWMDSRVIRASTISPVQWEHAFAVLPLVKSLPPADKKRLQELAILFINDKVFEGAHGLEVTVQMMLIIALQACLPVLNFGSYRYDGWTSIIIYPSGFAPERTYTDEYGVQHHVQDSLSGESWLHGPVILSWDDTQQSGVIDGDNLVIHEFAHKLDMENGVANGFPALHSDMQQQAWVRAFSEGYEDFQARCERNENIGISCYGASSPAEFFAVLSEVFFERPDIIDRHYADIYDQLRQYYRQDTLSRLR